MKRQTVSIEVTQSIVETATQQVENWQLETKGDWLQLKTFEKITYQDQHSRQVEVKWLTDCSQLEIRYDATKMILNPTMVTQLEYLTAQGRFYFEVKTNELLITSDEVKVTYQLLMENKPIGDYDFRLIYHQ